MREIENSKLTLDLIPGPDAGWEEIFDFAQTFNGYKHYSSDDLERIYERKGYKTLDELRASLFYYQRVWHWYCEVPEGEYLERFKSMVQAIRERILEEIVRGNPPVGLKDEPIMSAAASRAIANDMYLPPFTELPIADQFALRKMCSKEIMTFDDYLRERNRLIDKLKDKTAREETLYRSNKLVEPFSPRIREFIQSVTWTYAYTMPEWPHEYIVRYKVDKDLFLEMVRHIREYGYKGSFYEKTLTYFKEGSKVYWTMGEPLEKTAVIK